VSPDELRALIARNGAGTRDFFLAGHPPDLMSPLFNMPARLVVGSHCYYEHAPDILRRAAAAVPAAELGRRAKTLGHRPNVVGINSLMLGYLNGREQRRLVAGLGPREPLPGERYENTETVVAFWRDFMEAYVEEDGALMTSEMGYRLPILSPADADAAAALTRPVDEGGDRTPVRRMMAVVQLYTFIQNGEARVGSFAHGPYPRPDGTVLLVKELVGLRDRFIDLGVEERPHLDTVVRLMRVRDVAARFDQYGSLSTEPFEIEDAIVADALVTIEDGRVRPLAGDEVARLIESAGSAQVAAYERAAEWTTDERIAYGADLYASLILTITAAAGLDLTDEVRTRFRATAARVVPGLRDGTEAPLVLAHIGSDSADVYSPVLPDPVEAM
jgi:hypothetical protein